ARVSADWLNPNPVQINRFGSKKNFGKYGNPYEKTRCPAPLVVFVCKFSWAPDPPKEGCFLTYCSLTFRSSSRFRPLGSNPVKPGCTSRTALSYQSGTTGACSTTN